MVKSNAKPFLALLVVTALFYWKTLFTGQFSLLTQAEGVNQAYSWLLFWIRTIRHGELPLWDSLTDSGRSFLGEMQTAAFDPLHLPFLLVKLDAGGLLPIHSYHVFIAAVHFLGCFLFYLMARSLGRSRFASLLAGIFFGLGGIVGALPWPHMLESAIWLPLIFLLLARSFRAETGSATWTLAALAGCALGLSTLAGGFHLVLMQGLVIVSFGAYYAYVSRLQGTDQVLRICGAAAVAAIVAVAAGSIQLLPSLEYGPLALRWFGKAASLSNERIPYLYTDDNRMSPLAFLNLLFPSTSRLGTVGAGEVWTPYISVIGLVLAMIGVWKNWANPIVRYAVGLAVIGFVYSLGSISLLNGLGYVLIPKLWMARESTRFIYLTHFGLCTAAAFGCDTLLRKAGSVRDFDQVRAVVRWTVAGIVATALLAGLLTPQGLGQGEGFSILAIGATWFLLEAVWRGHRGKGIQFFLVCLAVSDLYAFAPRPDDLALSKAAGADYLTTLRDGAGVCRFLRSRPGVFRVDARLDSTPNFGDAYGVPENKGAGVTSLFAYRHIIPRFDLLNEEYILQPASDGEPGPVYQDPYWKVYANARAFPRVWTVHQIWLRPSEAETLADVSNWSVDLHVGAVMTGKIAPALSALRSVEPEEAHVTRYRQNSLSVSGRTGSTALLVLSENWYPGWRAKVNGKSTPVLKVDGSLRGVVVPPGAWQVDLYYSPLSVWLGALLSAGAFLVTALAAARNRQALRRAFTK